MTAPCTVVLGPLLFSLFFNLFRPRVLVLQQLIHAELQIWHYIRYTLEQREREEIHEAYLRPRQFEDGIADWWSKQC
jgi:hypothetical protein